MGVADQPPPLHLAHDVLDRVERGRLAWLVVHCEKDAGRNLQAQHRQGERAEVVPYVPVLRRRIFRQVFAQERAHGQSRVEPIEDAARSHHALPAMSAGASSKAIAARTSDRDSRRLFSIASARGIWMLNLSAQRSITNR